MEGVTSIFNEHTDGRLESDRQECPDCHLPKTGRHQDIFSI